MSEEKPPKFDIGAITKEFRDDEDDDNIAAGEEASGESPQPPGPSPEYLARLTQIRSEDPLERAKRIMKINKYLNDPMFGAYLQSLGQRFDPMMTIEEMEKQLKEIISYVRNQGSDSMLEAGIPMLQKGIDAIITATGLVDARGSTEMMMRSPQYRKILHEIALESDSFTDTSPIVRLGVMHLTTIVAIQAHKMAAEAVKPETVDSATEEKLNSL